MLGDHHPKLISTTNQALSINGLVRAKSRETKVVVAPICWFPVGAASIHKPKTNCHSNHEPTSFKHILSYTILILPGWWFQPLSKIWKSVGIMKFPIYGKIKAMFQTTNQLILLSYLRQGPYISLLRCPHHGNELNSWVFYMMAKKTWS